MSVNPENRTLWEKVAGNLQEWYTEAVGWTGEKARIGVKMVDIVGIQHNIKKSMTHLGGRVYDLIQRGVAIESDEQVQVIVGNLRRLEEELAGREGEIDTLRGSRRAAEEAAGEGAPGVEAAAPREVQVAEPGPDAGPPEPGSPGPPQAT
ncbi:MAG: hypothetical protein ACE5G2_05580 [Candidatus Krumholzibacteriia bacterium]